MFRNHAPGVRLGPVLVVTPFRCVLRVGTLPGTFLVVAVGVAMVLVAPWVTRAVVAADRWLLRALLGPGKLAQRVADLEETRAHAVDDSAALLRRIERDLHDGAQVRLAALAMNLGMAKEKLGDDGDPPDVDRRPRAGGRRPRERQGRPGRAPRPRPRHPPAGAGQRPGRRAGHARGRSAVPVDLSADSRSGPPRRSRPSPTSAPPSCWPTWPSTARRTRIGLRRPDGTSCSS